ncbi:MAG: hypothetical protein JWM35_1129 [Verrucomicrobia bacterium]|nr:hypothetical protein [Verrucomicrobiota bacterium]
MSAKIQVPEELKADMPPNAWGKVLAATPIVMTVIATLLAGLSSSEMTRAQYDRSLAAQQQSKAGDQWSYFQAKKLRAALQRNTLDMISSSAPAHPLDADALAARLANSTVSSSINPASIDILVHGNLPSLPPDPHPLDARIVGVLAAIDAGQPDAEIAAALTRIKEADLAAALRAAGDRVRASDALLKPVTQSIDTMEKEFGRTPADPLSRDFVVARLNFAAARYESESRQNQLVAQLYELQVRQSNVSAERHHLRSQRFFYGMLAAQLAVIMSTFSMAARKHNFLWALAATAGTAALAFAAYVYLFI